ncbi:MAG: hypothetical protein ACLPN5_17225 [Roseiarcus sp.]
MVKSTTWTGTEQDSLWADAGNWSKGTPVAGETAEFDDGLTWVVELEGAGNAAQSGELAMTGGSLYLGGGELDLLPTIPESGIADDFVLDGAASLTVLADARLVGNQVAWIGQDGSAARMDVLGVVQEEYALVHGGELVVSGKGHWITGQSGIEVGGSGHGTLIVADGGHVDEGANGLTDPAASLALGDGSGDGSAEVIGAGSRLALTEVYLGNGYSGKLTISDGGVVVDEVGVVAEAGDGYVVIDGAGSRWSNLAGLSFSQIAPTDSSIAVTRDGELDWGGSGFGLYDNLYLDGSAVLHGRTIFDGGQIDALAGEGDVTVTQDIDIVNNWLFQNQELAAVSSAEGAALILAGHISGDAQSILYAGAGHVEVTHTNNAFGMTEIYGATLEAATAGALGKGAIEFVGGTTKAELQIGGGSPLGNTIEDFGAADAIDLLAFGYDKGIRESWTSAAGGGGTLTLTFDGAKESLHFGDAFSAASFTLGNDGGGGALVRLKA